MQYRKWCEENKRHAKNKEHFYRDVRAPGIDANFRWDPETAKTRDKDGKKVKERVRGYSINRNYTNVRTLSTHVSLRAAWTSMPSRATRSRR